MCLHNRWSSPLAVGSRYDFQSIAIIHGEKLYNWRRPDPKYYQASWDLVRERVEGRFSGCGPDWPRPPSWDGSYWIHKHCCPTKVNHNLKKHTRICAYVLDTPSGVHVSYFNTFLFNCYIYLLTLKSLSWKHQFICFSVWITLANFALERSS